MIDFRTNLKGMNEIEFNKVCVLIPDEMVEMLKDMLEADFYSLKLQIKEKWV